jgi:hypothetical protein
VDFDFNVIDNLLIGYFEFVRQWKKKEYNGTVHQLLVDFEKAYDLARRIS